METGPARLRERSDRSTKTGRAEVLAALSSVDYVAIFPKCARPLWRRCARVYVRRRLQPETLTRRSAPRWRNRAQIRILPFAEGYSTSRLIEKLADIEP
jgi:bifunctional ADP-heptose synthase (sugar kinase/adenylyltransferase)